jgi:hypothetical protein
VIKDRLDPAYEIIMVSEYFYLRAIQAQFGACWARARVRDIRVELE